MGERTGIAWTDHTFNPWIGCTKISAGCAKCYAETFVRNRMGRSHWGNDPRARTKGPWREVLRWNRAAAAEGVRRRVFCASLCDVFEDAPGLDEIRADLWPLIEQCAALDWQLLTKRPENMRRMLPAAWLKSPRPNVWLGTSCEDQRAADERTPLLLQTPAAVRFLSCEPLLGPIDLRRWFPEPMFYCSECGRELMRPDCRKCGTEDNTATNHLRGVDWVIVGGESGPGARPCCVPWIRSLVQQCETARVTCFVKQMGARSGWSPFARLSPEAWIGWKLRDRKGGDPAEWPEDLRVRQFPEART